MFRYYDPVIGRYISRDPAGYGDGPNVYLYVHNNPINFIDPLGLGLEVDGDKERVAEEAAIQKRDQAKKDWYPSAEKKAEAIKSAEDGYAAAKKAYDPYREFNTKTHAWLDKLEKNPQFAELLRQLRKSENTHVIKYRAFNKDSPQTNPNESYSSGNGSSTIWFDPNYKMDFDNVEREEHPLYALGHELYHSWEYDLGIEVNDPNAPSREKVKDVESYVPWSERRAVRAENILRPKEAERKTYGEWEKKGNPVPGFGSVNSVMSNKAVFMSGDRNKIEAWLRPKEYDYK
jgi:hypothetical protein